MLDSNLMRKCDLERARFDATGVLI